MRVTLKESPHKQVNVTTTEGLEPVHRQLSSLLLSTTILVYALMILLAASSPELTRPFWLAISPVIVIGAVAQLFVWRKFRLRDIAIQHVKLSWVVVCGACSILGLLHFVRALQGNLVDWLLGGMLFYLAWSLFSRFSTPDNPVYRGWYSGSSSGSSPLLDLKPGEMLAACPHCSSLLAVRPEQLGADERCPNHDCGGRLVLESTLSRLAEEE